MKTTNITTVGVAITAIIAFSATALVQRTAAQSRDQGRDSQYAGSLDARQHGYEHAYRDGADRARQDRERRASYSLKENDYQSGARGYERAFGDKAEYMQGYREGYKRGYDDVFNGRAGQYSQLYGRPQSGGRMTSRDDDVYAQRPYSATDMAFDTGYRDGLTIGQQDRGRRGRSNYRENDSYRNADLGYRSSYGDRDDYKVQFRDGFERGYEDGFRGSQDTRAGSAGNSGNGSRNRSSNADANNGRFDNGARSGQSAPGGTFTVTANRQWTPTGIRVNQGEVLHLTSTGEIRFTGNADDRAGVAGSPAHKFVSGAPLPTALAGALIGRIDSGLPFGIGDQSSIVMPASGLLYLGTNDDNVSDNSGQFQVVISTGR
jgi:hypothetical protein